MQADNKNMERMVEVVPDSEWQSLQNFLSYSPWRERGILDQLARDANHLIGGDADSCFIVDESAVAKKGHKSVGVSRQWNGRLGKIDTCQVGVYGALCRRDQAILIDTRLFLPESWTNDPDRCVEAGVPEDRLAHCKKAELALDLVKLARHNGVDFQWVGGDAFYGDDPEFLRQLDQLGETFMLDIHKDQTIYLKDPAPYISQRKPTRGRRSTRLQTDQLAVEVGQWAEQQPQSAWEKMLVRNSTKGFISARVLHRQVWLWDGEEQQAHQWHLVVSEPNMSKNNRKYSLSNAPSDTPISRLVYMQGQRYWVERAIEDGKSHAGLADYQVRSWTGWHHHMAMVMLALLFMLETKIKHEDSHQLLSCYDIQVLLSHFLPRRDITKQEVIRQMHIRHKQRAASIEFYRRT
jgi:SRSO17 transposase